MTKPTGRPRVAEYDQVGKACPQCGGMFYLRDRPWQSFGKFQKRKFCSVLCADKARGASTTSEGFNHHAFWERTVQASSGCIEWTGRLLPKGYGRLIVNRRSVRAHRVAYEITRGPIPDGMMVLHSCDNPRCVNPDHLRTGTAADNWADVIARNRRSPNQMRAGRA